MSLFDRFKQGFSKSRAAVWDRLGGLFRGRKLDEELYEELEEVLLAADVGFDTSVWLVDQVRRYAKETRATDAEQLPELLQRAMVEALADNQPSMSTATSGPSLYLFVGVNGVGKTTSIGKLAHYYKSQGKKVLLVAGDTFRAAAIEQLMEWGDRAGCEVIHHEQGSDPAAVVYDAIAAAKARGVDVILCDTAGRLHNKSHLMAELSKIHKVAARELDGAPHEVLLVLDGTTGQNALMQAKAFLDVASVSGLIVTKLDGTAKGGVLLPIVREYQIPVKWVGLGEKRDDLQPFSAEAFAEAICQVSLEGKHE